MVWRGRWHGPLIVIFMFLMVMVRLQIIHIVNSWLIMLKPSMFYINIICNQIIVSMTSFISLVLYIVIISLICMTIFRSWSSLYNNISIAQPIRIVFWSMFNIVFIVKTPIFVRVLIQITFLLNLSNPSFNFSISYSRRNWRWHLTFFRRRLLPSIIAMMIRTSWTISRVIHWNLMMMLVLLVVILPAHNIPVLIDILLFSLSLSIKHILILPIVIFSPLILIVMIIHSLVSLFFSLMIIVIILMMPLILYIFPVSTFNPPLFLRSGSWSWLSWLYFLLSFHILWISLKWHWYNRSLPFNRHIRHYSIYICIFLRSLFFILCTLLLFCD